jgi:predicted transcriptional regulator
MVVHLSPEQEQELSKLAGRNAEELAQAVIGYYLDHQARFVEAVKRGLGSLDRGDFVSHAEVGRANRTIVATLMKIRWSPEAAEDL